MSEQESTNRGEPEVVELDDGSTGEFSSFLKEPGVNKKGGTSKKEIEDLVHQKSDRISYKKRSSSRTKSEVWLKFELIYMDGKEVPFVRCITCSGILAYTMDHGTNALARHMSKTCPGQLTRANTGGQLKLQPKATSFASSPVPHSAVQQLNDDITLGLAKDLRPLGAVNATGFLYMVQKLIDFGAKYGHQNASNVVYHPSTLKRSNLQRLFQTTEEEVRNQVCAAPQYPALAFTTDMITDKHQSRSFLSLTVHYIDSNWQLQKHLLGLEEFKEKKKSRNNIREECKKILARYFESDMVEQIISASWIMTDGGSNLVDLFPGKRLDCQCHRLNLFVKWMLNDKRLDAQKIQQRDQDGRPYPEKNLFVLEDKCPGFKGSLNGVKKLVGFFKRSGLNSSLKTTLKQDVPTRWNSELIMLQSYDKSSDEVMEVLVKHGKLSKLIGIDNDKVKELVGFLQDFKNFSSDQKPTMHEVLPTWHLLKEHIADADHDSSELRELKKQAQYCYAEYFNLPMIYFVAAFMDPRIRKLKFLDDVARQNTHDEVLRRMIEELDKEKESVTQGFPKSQGQPRIQEATPAKKSRLSSLYDSSDEDEVDLSPRDISATAKEEFNRYLSEKLHSNTEYILEFWRGAPRFPILQRLARKVLSIPASQSSDERVFSSAGSALNPRRAQLGGTTLSKLIFLHKNCLKK